MTESTTDFDLSKCLDLDGRMLLILDTDRFIEVMEEVSNIEVMQTNRYYALAQADHPTLGRIIYLSSAGTSHCIFLPKNSQVSSVVA